MTPDALSLSRAVADAANDVALVTDQREWTFADVLSAARRQAASDGPAEPSETPSGRRAALWGRRTLPSLLRLYSLLDRGDVVTMLHPSWAREAAWEAVRRSRSSVVYDDDSVEKIGDDLQDPGRVVAEPVSAARNASMHAPSSDQDWVRGLVLFTSGTTGRPKGVVLSLQALVAAAEASGQRLGWQAGDRWLLRLPIAHVGGLSIVTRCLAARATVVLDSSMSFEPRDFVERVERTATTLVSLVPTMLHRLVESRLRAPDSVRLALIGGAAARPELLGRAADLGWPTATTYGMTEACSQIATSDRQHWGRAVDHVGRELAGLELRLVDDSDEVVPEGEAGLLQIRGPSLFDGYLGESRRDPARWFRTGDWAQRDRQGHLRVLARRTDMIVTGGENVAPTRVESALIRHPDIDDACVVGLDDAEWGQRVAALLVPRRSGEHPPDASIQDFLRETLSNFELPRRLVWAEAVPTMPSGKIDRQAVIRRLEADRG